MAPDPRGMLKGTELFDSSFPPRSSPVNKLHESLPHVNWVTALFLVITPAVALVWGGVHISLEGVHAIEVVLFFLYVAATGLSITAGYHRHFAHGAYECRRFVKAFYLLFGAAAFQHSVLNWASDHRRHHLHIDEDEDPYNIKRGFLWAHIGWLMVKNPNPEDFSNVPDLVADPLVSFQHRYYVPLAVLMGFGVPLALGWAMGHPWGVLLWAGFFRVVAVHHSTFLVNSLAHTLGTKPYSLAVSARDSLVTAVLTMGEGYHNFHHRFATDYRNGVRRHQWDPTKWLIRGMASLGWAWGLTRVPREKIVAAELECDAQRLLEGTRGRSAEAAAYVRERIGELSTAVHGAAARLGELERQIAQARDAFGSERRKRVRRLRAELRMARRELRAAKVRWRGAVEAMITETLSSPSPQLA
jgi:stearoyl-CoA desaturase (Delta-9 desaturase)